jgi:hypothetical protein
MRPPPPGAPHDAAPTPVDQSNYASSSAVDGVADVLDEIVHTLVAMGIEVEQVRHPKTLVVKPATQRLLTQLRGALWARTASTWSASWMDFLPLFLCCEAL